MDVFQKRTALTLLAIPFISGLQLAQAASSSQASIDWSSLSVQIIDMSGGMNVPVFSWVSASGDSNAYSDTQDPYEHQDSYLTAYDFNSVLSTHAVTALAQSSGLRNGNIIQADAASLGDVRSNGASAGATNSSSFQLSGNGIALLTLNWSLSVTANTLHWPDYAASSINIIGNYYDSNGSNVTSNTIYALNSIYSGESSHNGTFAFAVFSDGIHNPSGNLVAWVTASSYSSVPIPGALWLFGSGLLGLVWRKQKTA